MRIRRLLEYAVAPATVAAALMLHQALAPWLQNAVFMLFWVAVISTAVLGGFGPAVLAASLSVLAVDHFILSPGSLTMTSAEALESLIFLLASGSTGLVAAALRRSRSRHREAEERFHELTENLREAFWIKDAATGGIIYMSPAYETIWQRPRQPIYESFDNFLDTLHPGDRDRVIRALPAQLAGGYSEEYRIVRPDGGVRWIHARAFPVRDVQGKVHRIAGLTQDITDRKHAEEALRASEARLRGFFDQAAVGIGYSTPDGRLVEFNDRFAAIFGYTRDEMMRLTYRELTMPDDLPEGEHLYADLLAGRISHYSREKRCLKKDASVIWVNMSLSLVRDAQGKPQYSLAIIDDVTERKRTEEALQESETRVRERDEEIRLITDSLPALVSYVDAGGYYRFVNHMYEEWFGVPRESIRGRHVRDVLGEAGYEITRPYIDAVLQGQRTEFQTRFPYGPKARHVQAIYVPHTDSEGKVLGFFALVVDVTDRVQIEEALRASEQRFRVALQNSRIGVYTTDRDLRYTWIYDPQSQIPPEQVVGKRADELVPPDLAQRLNGMKEKVLATGQGARDLVEIDVDGHYSVRDILIEPWRSGNGDIVGVIGAVADVTDIKRAERDLRELNDQLEQRVAERTQELLRSQAALHQSERLAAIGQMMAGLSHESRNALQRSYACLQMLERRFPENPAALGLVREALSANEDLRQVFEEVQGYAAPIVLDRERADLREVCRRAWESLAALRCDRDTTLEEDARTDNLVCDIDTFRIEQVFRNLMENSLAAVPDPLKLTVTCTDAHWNGAPALHVSVRDNGPGITPEMAQRVFEPFYTTKTKGTGLGMSIVKRIIEAHGGAVSLNPNPSTGLEVTFTLPR